MPPPGMKASYLMLNLKVSFYSSDVSVFLIVLFKSYCKTSKYYEKSKNNSSVHTLYLMKGRLDQK